MASDNHETMRGLAPLSAAPDGTCGGKAAGLKGLIRAGLPVPDGFVVIDAGRVPAEEILRAARALGGGPFAVRSSASDEDGAGASFAGQYRTFLDVRGDDALLRAVRDCADSAAEGRAAAYRDAFAGGARASSSGIPVVVQKMVPAAYAGVAFTADPVTGDRGHIAVEAAEGVGEKVVGGETVAWSYRVTRETGAPAPGGARGLPGHILKKIADGALAAEASFGMPLDLEWAADDRGDVYWLQARPITTLGGPDINEFDHPARPDQFFTLANIGEMMPGAVSTLTLDVFGDAIDFCIRHFYKKAGAIRRADRGERFVVSFYGHLFMNMGLMFKMTDLVLVSDRESFYRNLLGRNLEDGPAVQTAPLALRLFNTLRFARYISRFRAYRKKIERAAVRFDIPLATDDPAALYRDIDHSKGLLDMAYAWHLGVSTHSGVMNGILLEILRRGGSPVGDFDGHLAALLSDIEGIESAAALRSLEEIAALIRADVPGPEEFARLDPERALEWLRSPGSGAAGEAFGRFLARHGHRCIREAEFRVKDWGEDPLSLMPTLQKLAADGIRERPRGGDGAADALFARYPSINRRAFNWAIRHARTGVWNREHTKSLVIKIQGRFRHAYRRLARLLVDRCVLPDEDLVFFFTHAELGRLVRGGDPELVRRAIRRRRLLPEQAALRFPDVFRGAPVPLTAASTPAGDSAVLAGRPVSAGVVRGPARLVRSREDAERLRPGEIMVAAFTDIGWTPYYGTAGGLVTEVGCSLSHGAVVAREYGLPMVTAVPGMMGLVSDGDIVEIDGRAGTVTLVGGRKIDN